MRRPAGERSPTILAHEAERARRMADHFEERVAADPLLQARPNMAQLVLSAGLDFARAHAMGDFTEGRPRLAAWQARISALPSVRATV